MSHTTELPSPFETFPVLALLLSAVLSFDASPVPDTLVVVPTELRAALQPWVEYRQSQGHRLRFANSQLSAEAIRELIRELALNELRAVVLIGDASRRPTARGPALATPTHLAKARVNVHWGSEPDIATDNWYADLDDDQLPDLAIGRIPADNATELEMIVHRVMAYESSPDRGVWRRKLNFVAGVGGFGPLADTILESATKKFLTEGIPAEFHVSMTYGSWRSPFCPDPRSFRDTAINRFNEGCLFWVYIGHGQSTALDQIRVPGAAFPIFDTDDVGRLRPAGRTPIAIFLSCYAGAFDQQRDCLAEEMICSPGGPVAALAGSRVTMPYAMAVLGNELLGQYFQDRRETIGELFLHAKREMAKSAASDDGNANRRLLDALAKAISPRPDQLEAERLEHVLLFNLLGDPLLRLPHLAAVEVQVPRYVRAGESLTVSWETPVAGDCTLELVCRRDRTRESQPARARFDGSNGELDTYDEAYRNSNDRRWWTQQISCEQGTNSTVFEVPAESRGPCHVRMYVQGQQDCAAGAAAIFVRRPKPVAENGPTAK